MLTNYFFSFFSATVENGDFGALSALLTFARGSGDGAVMCSFVPILSDNVAELEENFFVVLMLLTPGNSFSLRNNITRVTFTNTDGKKVVHGLYYNVYAFLLCSCVIFCPCQGHCS